MQISPLLSVSGPLDHDSLTLKPNRPSLLNWALHPYENTVPN
jgi:hypothetical protein